ncbi:hypothetical protein [Marivita sp. GX14005]|uniref:hypothetical protein n=1 Tax=Marivita sp. GX14005 TaxID=2942276 RepID=UPI0020187749|nr:hypothetical protein [Marivita sp. GX14005]MCL3880808.1 hypothetical protein [Marivita sp. GX14005]
MPSIPQGSSLVPPVARKPDVHCTENALVAPAPQTPALCTESDGATESAAPAAPPSAVQMQISALIEEQAKAAQTKGDAAPPSNPYDRKTDPGLR